MAAMEVVEEFDDVDTNYLASVDVDDLLVEQVAGEQE
jgi:hypothetical protein